MIALDTNVLIRFFTADDDVQYRLAKALISKHQGMNKSIYISAIVLCELVWVLKSGYKYSRQQISKLLQQMTRTEEFAFSVMDELIEAILLYQNGHGDFADYLIYTINKNVGCESTYSFDGKIIKEGVFISP
jgi:predicted nucleic-acid-binding protein